MVSVRRPCEALGGQGLPVRAAGPSCRLSACMGKLWTVLLLCDAQKQRTDAVAPRAAQGTPAAASLKCSLHLSVFRAR